MLRLQKDPDKVHKREARRHSSRRILGFCPDMGPSARGIFAATVCPLPVQVARIMCRPTRHKDLWWQLDESSVPDQNAVRQLYRSQQRQQVHPPA